jgi:hypothetical protein
MEPFHFFTKMDQALLLGVKAKSVAELLEGVKSVPDASIYYHTHRFLQQHHYLSPEPPNDFAHWISEILNDDSLGEKLSSVDIIQLNSIGELRQRFVAIFEDHLAQDERNPECPPGEEFHFMACRTFILPTHHVARNMREFRDILLRISISSLYYHVFDAKLRLHGENDFSRWFHDSGLPELAAQIRQLDPYTHTLEGLRKRILVLAKAYDSH